MQGLSEDDDCSNAGNKDEYSDSCGSEEDTVHRDEDDNSYYSDGYHLHNDHTDERSIYSCSDDEGNSSDKAGARSDNKEMDMYNSAIIHVKLHHSLDFPLGLNIEGGCNTPLKYIRIKSLSPSSAAFNCGKLRAGDQLVMVGDECLIGLTFRKANLVLRRAPSTVEVIAQRKVMEDITRSTASYDRKTSMSGMILVLKFKCDSGETLGIKTIGGKDDPYLKNIHVRELVPDGVAARNGGIRRGDCILSVNNHNFVGLSMKEASSELAGVEGHVTIMINRTADHWMVPSDCKSDSVEKLLPDKTPGISKHTKKGKGVTFQLPDGKSAKEIPHINSRPDNTTTSPHLKSCLKQPDGKFVDKIPHKNSPPTTDSPHVKSCQSAEEIPHINSPPENTITSPHLKSCLKQPDSKSAEEIPHKNSPPDNTTTDHPHVKSSQSAEAHINSPPDTDSQEIPHINSPPANTTTDYQSFLKHPDGKFAEEIPRRQSSPDINEALQPPKNSKYCGCLPIPGPLAAMCLSYSLYKKNAAKKEPGEDSSEGTRQTNMPFQLYRPDYTHDTVESWRMSLQYPEYLEDEPLPPPAKYKHGKRIRVNPRGEVLTFKSDTSTLPRKIAGSKLGVHLIELQKDSSHGLLGMRLRGSVNDAAPIIVKDIIRGGPADKSGKIQRGDEVIEVNGVSYASMSIAEAIGHMRKIPRGKVKIIVRSHAEIQALNDIRKMLATM